MRRTLLVFPMRDARSILLGFAPSSLVRFLLYGTNGVFLPLRTSNSADQSLFPNGPMISTAGTCISLTSFLFGLILHSGDFGEKNWSCQASYQQGETCQPWFLQTLSPPESFHLILAGRGIDPCMLKGMVEITVRALFVAQPRFFLPYHKNRGRVRVFLCYNISCLF